MKLIATWTMIVWLVGAGGSMVPSVTTVEGFSDRAACEAAAKVVASQGDFPHVTAFCIEVR